MPYVAARFAGVTTSEPAIEPLIGRGPTRGWCPGVLEPMETGDGWLLRIRVPGGFVTPGSLKAVTEISAEFGSGIVEVTSRANLQIRGVALNRLEQATTAAVAADLVGGDARRDAFRAVASNPLTGHDPGAVCDSRPVVEALVARLVDGIIGNAPSKFGIVIDDGGTWMLDDLDADVALRACAEGTWAVFLRGVPDAIGCTSRPVEVAETATQWCVDEASRMDRLVAAVGIADIADGLAVAAPSRDACVRRRPKGPARIIGVLPHADPVFANVVAAPFLGRADTRMLAGIAELADAHDAVLRLTPDHSFAFCGISAKAGTSLLCELRVLGLVVDRDDPRASISACVGSLGCSWALADTWAVGHELAATSQPAERVHLSACAKQCGAPARVRQLVADATGTFR